MVKVSPLGSARDPSSSPLGAQLRWVDLGSLGFELLLVVDHFEAHQGIMVMRSV